MAEKTEKREASKKQIIFDFETRSQCDLKKSGAFKYSVDPSTQPTCLAFKEYGNSLIHFLPFEKINLPWERHEERLRVWWFSRILEDYLFAAHNAFFERCIYQNILVKRLGWPEIPARQYRCTAAKAAACALPRSLQGAGEAMNLIVQKDFKGYAAMMATCKPTKAWNAWEKKGKVGPEPPVFLEPDAAPYVWQTLYQYCKIDVMTEENLDRALPDLIPEEQEIWFLNQELNWRGLRIDIPTVRKIVSIMAVENKSKLKELDSLTMGLVAKPGAIQSIRDFLLLDGIDLPDLRAQTVNDTLQSEDLSEDMRRLLELRKALSLTSTKKYESFLSRANGDDRVCDILMYHGASTGRDTGTGVQPHNFPRGVIEISEERPYAAVENVIECDHELLTILYGDTLPLVFSSILRNMIIPSEGCELFVSDFSKIEVAVLWWLADNLPGLKILKSGKDPYKYQAAANLGKKYEDIPDKGDDRQLGKAQILGCGFGMGWEKFQSTAWSMYRLKLTEDQSRKAVKNYRETHSAVPELWKAYEAAAITSVTAPKQIVEVFKCKFLTGKGFLWAKLPSGRNLAYRSPQTAWREGSFGGSQRTLEFMGVNSKTKKWALERTWGGTLTENIVQAVARDLMMQAMVRLEKAGYKALLTVHDEVICEKPIGTGDLDEFNEILCETPEWAEGLPIEAKGWKGPRYRK